MLNSQLKLNEKMFEAGAEKTFIRDGFGAGIVEAAEKDEKIVALCADLDESLRLEEFKKKFPERFVQMGVAEQNMAAVASGLANYGKIPFICSFAVFSPGRNWEQIRTTIAINNLPVKIIGSHTGLSAGPDGATHQMLEDIALMRVLPNMKVIIPCDAEEARKAILASAKIAGPVYIRLARPATPIITSAQTPFELGKAEIFWKSEKEKPSAGIIACGTAVADALFAAKELETEGISVSVLNLHTVKPIDKRAIIELAKTAGAIVAVEDHQIAGGMGSAVAEVLAENFPAPIEFVGVRDRFGQSGTSAELSAHYGIDKNAIKEAVKKVISRKK